MCPETRTLNFLSTQTLKACVIFFLIILVYTFSFILRHNEIYKENDKII